MATNIDINEVTNATTVEDGTGIFDKLIGVAFLHIEKQVDEQRLTQSTAGEVYAAAIQSAMAQAIQFVLQEKQLEAQVDLTIAQKDELLLNGAKQREKIDADIANADKQREVMTAQQALYARQTTAFDDNKYQKLLDSQLNYNGIVFQDADNPDVLDVALEAKVNDVFNKLIGSSEITSMPEA